jgi:hypothetical protein
MNVLAKELRMFITIILLQGIILKENGKVGDAERMFIQVSI